MRAYEFILLEYDSGITFDKWHDKIEKVAFNDLSLAETLNWGTLERFRERNASKQHTDSIVKIVIKACEYADPTKNKEYVTWLLREYTNGNIRQYEDITSTAMDTLATYHKAKIKKLLPPEYKDIGRLKLKDVMNVVQSLSSKVANDGDATVYYEDKDIRVIIPNDLTASKYYGSSDWCTTYPAMFNKYSKDGTLYIIIPKNPERDGEKYQFHFESGQFMNENDAAIADNDSGRELLNRYPVINNIFKKQAISAGNRGWWMRGDDVSEQEIWDYAQSAGWDRVLMKLQNPSDKDIKTAITVEPRNIMFVKRPQEEWMQLLGIKGSNYDGMPLSARYEPNDTRTIVKYLKKPSEKVQMAAVKKCPESIVGMDEPTKAVQEYAISKDEGLMSRIKNLHSDILLKKLQD